MPTSEKFCLKWNDFQENVNIAFRDLRKDCEFTDVTLACEDGHQVEAHKVILSASSPFFQNLNQNIAEEFQLNFDNAVAVECSLYLARPPKPLYIS